MELGHRLVRVSMIGDDMCVPCAYIEITIYHTMQDS